MPSNLAERFGAVLNTVRTEYDKPNSEPWMVAYSGGKDSTLLLHIVWEVMLSLPKSKRTRQIYIVSNDTLVESPLVINHLKSSLKTIEIAARKTELPIRVSITTPYVDQTFWVNLIGKGYIPPTRNFRWCTDRMKIEPTNQLLKGIVNKHKRAILLIGTRKSESQNRRRNMERLKVKPDTMNPHGSIAGCFMFAPLADLTDNDVWQILMQRQPPWGGTHRRLITLYRSAGGGECPLVLTKEDAPSCGTTSPRFGCWTCTVVEKDRSMRGVIDSGHTDSEKLELLADFREWLIELRENDDNRMSVRRDGNTKHKENNAKVMGPFKISIRKQILNRLESLQTQLNEQLISPDEVEFIIDMWERDQIKEEARQSLIKSAGVAV